MLVPVLAALAGPGKPLHREFSVRDASLGLPRSVKDRHRHCRSVNSALSLGRGNPLDAMAACLVVQGIGSLTADAENRRAVRARVALNPSSVAGRQPLVSRGQVLNEKFRVVAAFSGPNFDDAHPKNLPTPDSGSK